jgi:hypothetical protein
LIHSVERVSTIVAWSPNIMIMYFIPSLPSPAPWVRHDWVGAVEAFSTSGGGNPRRGGNPSTSLGMSRVLLDRRPMS